MLILFCIRHEAWAGPCSYVRPIYLKTRFYPDHSSPNLNLDSRDHDVAGYVDASEKSPEYTCSRRLCEDNTEVHFNGNQTQWRNASRVDNTAFSSFTQQEVRFGPNKT